MIKFLSVHFVGKKKKYSVKTEKSSHVFFSGKIEVLTVDIQSSGFAHNFLDFFGDF